ncbi:MAG TPA: MMPL family transporter [Oscillospiraceae bacterium]|nr:MMPL family transporter [Oscillospiraceae bacterium]
MNFKRVITKTYQSMGPAVLIAMIATILGFVALLISPVPMIADFGKMLALGLVLSFLAALIILTVSLYIKDKFFSPAAGQKNYQAAPVDRLEQPLAAVTRQVLRYKFVIILLALLITLGGLYGNSKVGVQTDIEQFMPQDTPELQEIRELREVIGSTEQVTIMLQSEQLLTTKNIEWIDTITQELPTAFPEAIVDVRSITSVYRELNTDEFAAQQVAGFIDQLPAAQRKMLIDESERASAITVNLARLETSKQESFITQLAEYLSVDNPAEIDVTITGQAVIDVQMMTALTSGRTEMTLLGMGLVFLGLLVIYRSFLKALIPILPISLIVGWSGGAMYLLGFNYTPLTATMGALIIGIGTEFTIILMQRYFEEKNKGLSKDEAMIKTVGKIGKPILASALTTIAGFSALIFSDFLILREFGIVTLLNIIFCLLSSLVVLPPLIVLLDRKPVAQKA